MCLFLIKMTALETLIQIGCVLAAGAVMGFGNTNEGKAVSSLGEDGQLMRTHQAGQQAWWQRWDGGAMKAQRDNISK